MICSVKIAGKLIHLRKLFLMNKFKHRIKYYLVGFAFGIAAVVFFFGQRGCTWLPGNRVKATISENKIVLGDSMQAVLDCLSPDSQPVYDLLNYEGDVDFSNSDTKSDHKVYIIENNNGLKASFKLFEGYSEIIALSSPDLACNVELSNDIKHPLVLPKKIINQIIDSHKFYIYDTVKYQMDCYNIPLDSLYRFHLKGDKYESPEREDLVNRIFNISLKYEEKDYKITYEIGENRTRIKFIKGESPCEVN